MGLRNHDLDLEKIEPNGSTLVNERTHLDGLTRALEDAFTAIRSVGPDRIDLVTVTKDRICIQPADLDDGERIARALGCDLPLDHRMLVPAHTLWTGTRHGLEIQVRSALRRPIGEEA
ncbi:hypothetical protein [Promicromonospora sp. NPDC023987]|uniref:hypothetical protein n=1 Tax=Promicromonospora sp. NPDC023987 TaxID=3155360 RepID=UPI0033E815A9